MTSTVYVAAKLSRIKLAEQLARRKDPLLSSINFFASCRLCFSTVFRILFIAVSLFTMAPSVLGKSLLRTSRPVLQRTAFSGARYASSGSLKEVFAAKIPENQEKVKKLRKDYGSKVVGEVTLDQVYGGGKPYHTTSTFLYTTANHDTSSIYQSTCMGGKRSR